MHRSKASHFQLECPLRNALRRADLTSMERPPRLIAFLLLHHGLCVAAEFRENGDRPLAGSVNPINTYAVVGVSVFRDLERIGRSAVVKFHGQRIRREDVVGDVTTPLSGDVFICHCVGGVCRPGRKQNRNRCSPSIFHDFLEAGARANLERVPCRARQSDAPARASPISHADL
jgi:hypothetical protein